MPEEIWDEQLVKKYFDLLLSIGAPLSQGEAELLLAVLADGDGFGFNQTLMGLIETAPDDLVRSEPPTDANEWVQLLWIRKENARRLGRVRKPI